MSCIIYILYSILYFDDAHALHLKLETDAVRGRINMDLVIMMTKFTRGRMWPEFPDVCLDS